MRKGAHENPGKRVKRAKHARDSRNAQNTNNTTNINETKTNFCCATRAKQAKHMTELAHQILIPRGLFGQVTKPARFPLLHLSNSGKYIKNSRVRSALEIFVNLGNIMVQSSQESNCKYWVTFSSVSLFAYTAECFARSLTHSRACGKMND